MILEFIAWAPRRLTEMALPLNQDNNSISAVINDGALFLDYEQH